MFYRHNVTKIYSINIFRQTNFQFKKTCTCIYEYLAYYFFTKRFDIPQIHGILKTKNYLYVYNDYIACYQLLYSNVIWYTYFSFQTCIDKGVYMYLVTNHKDSGRAPWISDSTFSVGIVSYAFQIAQTTKIQVSQVMFDAL